MPRFLSLHLMIVLLLGACAGDTGPTGPAGTQGQSGIQGPGGPEGPQGPEGLPLNWADVIEESEIDQPVYGIGLQVLGRTYVLGSGFAAHYSDAIWTNAHVARGLLDALDELSHLNPRPIAVRAGTVIGGSDTYDLTRYIIHHNYDGTTNSPDIGILISDTDLPSLASFLPREHANGTHEDSGRYVEPAESVQMGLEVKSSKLQGVLVAPRVLEGAAHIDPDHQV